MMRPGRDADEKQAARPREVNNLLHTLRGEQFRHSQNLRRSKAHLDGLRSRTYNHPSLPFSDIYQYAESDDATDAAGDEDRTRPPPLPVIRDGHLEHGYPRGAVPGPPPPKSWSGLFTPNQGRVRQKAESRDTAAFRKRALSLVFAHTPWSFGSSDVAHPWQVEEEERARARAGEGEGEGEREGEGEGGVTVPPLTQICVRVLLAAFPDADVGGFREELLAALPPMFRRDVLRYTAVHEPLPNGKLYALLEPEGHVDGEAIVVGPQAMLQRDLFAGLAVQREDGEGQEDEDMQEGSSGGHRPAAGGLSEQTLGGVVEEEEGEGLEGEGKEGEGGSWEERSSSSHDVPPPLHTLVVLNAQVPSTTLFLFPLTLTRLALLALPVPSPQVHRLPRICPLLEVLDLSYNPWLNLPPGGKGLGNMETTLDRIEWEKWARLRVLGLRMCNVPDSIAVRVNKGRLGDEVDIIGLEERTFEGTLNLIEGMIKSLNLSD